MKNKHICILVIVCAFLVFPFTLFAHPQHQLSNVKATKEAKALYAYINDMFGKKTLSGQMSSYWGFDEINYIDSITGKYPAIKGFDFIQSSLNDSVVKGAIQWWKDGGIPTIMWHWAHPALERAIPTVKKKLTSPNVFKKEP